MKKLITILFFVLAAKAAFSQFPSVQYFGSSTTLTEFRGATKADSGLAVGGFADTAHVNLNPYIKTYAGMLVRTANQLWMRNSTANKWLGPVLVSVPNLQAVFDAGTDLTPSNYSIDGGNGSTSNLEFTDFNDFSVNTASFSLPAIIGSHNAVDSMMVWNASSKTVGYRPIPSPGTGTLTNLATGLGLSGGPVTTTGTIIVDTTLIPDKLAVTNITSAWQYTTVQKFIGDALGVTQSATKGILLINNTAAVNGTQQMSPALFFQGRVFNTSGSTETPVAFKIDVLPVQAATGSATWQLATSINGGAFTNKITVSSSGTTTFGSGGSNVILGNSGDAFALTLSASTQISNSNTIGSQFTYRTTNGGSNVVPLDFFGNPNSSAAGSLGYTFDLTNQFSLTAGNGTRHIARASIQLAGLVNTAGSETGDMAFFTQGPTAGAAMSEKLRISSGGLVTIGTTSTATAAQTIPLTIYNTSSSASAITEQRFYNDQGTTTSDGFRIFYASSAFASPYASSAGFWNYEAGPIVFATNNSEKMRIATGGTLLLSGLTAGTNTWLNIGAGTTAVSQINLAAGTLRTTPVSGDVEYDGTNLYLTPTGAIRKTLTTNIVSRSAAQTAAVATVVTQTVGAADASYIISANVLVTTSTVHSFTVTCAYTDEGNTARTITMTFSNLAGTLLTAIANAAGAVPYEGVPLHIRAKAATTITLATTGTFTTVVYNIDGRISQIQ